MAASLGPLCKGVDARIARLFIERANAISMRIQYESLPQWELWHLQQIRESLVSEVKALTNGYYNILTEGLSDAAKLSVEESKAIAEKGYLGVLEASFNGSSFKTMGVLNQVNTEAVRAAFTREWADGLHLSERIWNIERYSENQVMSVIREGISEGRSAVEVSQDLQVYLAPERTDWFTVGRRRYMTNSVRTMKPYGRNLPFDCMRLARTEMSEAFREAKRVAAEVSPWVEGIKWNLSEFHDPTLGCECEDYATDDPDGLGEGIYKPENLPISHPGCICYETEETVPLHQFRSDLQEWIRGGKDWPEMDKWYQEIYMAEAA